MQVSWSGVRDARGLLAATAAGSVRTGRTPGRGLHAVGSTAGSGHAVRPNV